MTTTLPPLSVFLSMLCIGIRGLALNVYHHWSNFHPVETFIISSAGTPCPKTERIPLSSYCDLTPLLPIFIQHTLFNWLPLYSVSNSYKPVTVLKFQEYATKIKMVTRCRFGEDGVDMKVQNVNLLRRVTESLPHVN